MEYIAGIDIGTSGCKTVIIDKNGVEVSSSSTEYALKNIDGRSEMDPEDWFAAANSTLKTSCDKIGILPAQIVAVGCTGQMQGCTFIGYDGKPTRNSMVWFDNAPEAEAQKFNDEHGDVFLKNALIKSNSALMGSKIKWVMNNEPQSWEKTQTFLFASSYIAYMLTGVTAVDRSNLGFSGLNNVLQNGWSSQLIAITGVEQSKLPKLLDCLDILGKVSEDAAKITGLRAGTPVIAGCGDAVGETYAVNISGKSEMKLRLGSASAANAVIPAEWLGTKVKSAGPYVDKTAFLLGNYTKGCALSVKWVRETFFSELPKENTSYDIMDQEAINTPLGCNGLIYHPYLNGESAHYNDNAMRAKFTGIHFQNKRGDFVRSAYEGISFSIRDMIENDSVLSHMNSIIYCGGGTKSKIWFPILVDVLGISGVVPKSADAAFGVALMAGESIGVLNAAQAADNSRGSGIQVNFNEENHQKYSVIFKRYLELITHG